MKLLSACLASGDQQETNKLFKRYPVTSKIWWQTHLQTCTNPACVGISAHFMLIYAKRKQDAPATYDVRLQTDFLNI